MHDRGALHCAASNIALNSETLYRLDPTQILRPDLGRVIHVDATASAGGDGSRDRPYQGLHTALAAAASGDTIVVAGQQTLGTPESTWTTSKALRIYAGFSPGFGSRKRLPRISTGTTPTHRLPPPLPLSSDAGRSKLTMA